MYEIGDRVKVKNEDGTFLVTSLVQSEEGRTQYLVSNVSDEDNVLFVSDEELSLSGDDKEECVTASTKQANSVFVSALPDGGQLVFIYQYDKGNVGGYTLYRTKPGVFVTSKNWQESAKVLKKEKLDFDDFESVYRKTSEEFKADYTGSSIVPSEDFQKAAYADYAPGDEVSWKMGDIWLLGKVVGGMLGNNQTILVEDELGMIHSVFGSSLVYVSNERV